MNQKELTAILQKELEGQQDIAGRGVWTVDHCIRVSHLVLKLRKAVGASAKLDSLLFVAGFFMMYRMTASIIRTMEQPVLYG